MASRIAIRAFRHRIGAQARCVCPLRSSLRAGTLPDLAVCAPAVTSSAEGVHSGIHTYRSLCLLSLLRINLWSLFANFPRIDDEFERIRVLILFHQLQIGEPPSTFYGIAIGKLRLCGFIRSAAIAYFPSAARRSAALTICASERPR